MIKVYISLPIGGHEKTVRARYEEAKKMILSEYPDAIICGPVNISDFNENGLSVPRQHDWAWYMGEDMKELFKCTHIFMCQGYMDSRGCRSELAVAKEDGIIDKYHPKAMLPL